MLRASGRHSECEGSSSPGRVGPRDGGALAVRVDPDEKQLILQSNPVVYFETPHYHGYPAVLIRLEKIDRAELVERIEDAWLTRVPKRLAAQYLGS